MDAWNNQAFWADTGLTPLALLCGVLACALAIGVGVFLAKRQARAYGSTTTSPGHLPEVTFFDYGDMRFLHLGTPSVQGSMKLSKPFDIHLEYLQRMMAWLLFVDVNRVSHLHAMQLGLGAAALTKFCHKHLNMQTTAIELNPQVIATCRLWFHLPEDTARLKVLLADAAEVATQSQWRGAVDVLQVDLYDQEAASPVLDSEDFYRNCRDMLTPEGCMSVNIYGHAANDDKSMQKITAAFGTDAVWAFKPTPAGNTVVLAFRAPKRVDSHSLLSQAQAIEARWPLPATKWLKALRQRQGLTHTISDTHSQ